MKVFKSLTFNIRRVSRKKEMDCAEKVKGSIPKRHKDDVLRSEIFRFSRVKPSKVHMVTSLEIFVLVSHVTQLTIQDYDPDVRVMTKVFGQRNVDVFDTPLIHNERTPFKYDISNLYVLS